MTKDATDKLHKNAHNLSPELIDAMTIDAGLALSPDDSESAECEMEDPLTGMTFGLSVIEKFLLSVIDAHAMGGTSRRARLDAAMEALLNRKASRGPLPRDPNKSYGEEEAALEDALLWMGREYASAGRRKPSDVAIATAAAEKFFPTASPQYRHSRIDDLRARFSGSYDKKLKGWNPDDRVDVRRTYVFRAAKHDYVRESVEHQILRRIRDEFAVTGLRMTLPDE